MASLGWKAKHHETRIPPPTAKFPNYGYCFIEPNENCNPLRLLFYDGECIIDLRSDAPDDIKYINNRIDAAIYRMKTHWKEITGNIVDKKRITGVSYMLWCSQIETIFKLLYINIKKPIVKIHEIYTFLNLTYPELFVDTIDLSCKGALDKKGNRLSVIVAERNIGITPVFTQSQTVIGYESDWNDAITSRKKRKTEITDIQTESDQTEPEVTSHLPSKKITVASNNDDEEEEEKKNADLYITIILLKIINPLINPLIKLDDDEDEFEEFRKKQFSALETQILKLTDTVEERMTDTVEEPMTDTVEEPMTDTVVPFEQVKPINQTMYDTISKVLDELRPVLDRLDESCGQDEVCSAATVDDGFMTVSDYTRLDESCGQDEVCSAATVNYGFMTVSDYTRLYDILVGLKQNITKMQSDGKDEISFNLKTPQVLNKLCEIIIPEIPRKLCMYEIVENDPIENDPISYDIKKKTREPQRGVNTFILGDNVIVIMKKSNHIEAGIIIDINMGMEPEFTLQYEYPDITRIKILLSSVKTIGLPNEMGVEDGKGSRKISNDVKPTKNLIRPFGARISHSSWSMTDKEINPSPEGADLNLQRFKLDCNKIKNKSKKIKCKKINDKSKKIKNKLKFKKINKPYQPKTKKKKHNKNKTKKKQYNHNKTIKII